MKNLPPRGVIEGFYGKPWAPQDRLDLLEFANESHLDFYVYAPKGDAFLRRRWKEPYPRQNEAVLHALARRSRELGIRFGIGLSPYELYKNWNDENRGILREKFEFFRRVGVSIVGIFFDDMKGDQYRLAELQIEIAHFAAEHLPGTEIVLCPTYYSDDPILDQMFGERPDQYLKTLGKNLDPKIQVVWTGPRICTKTYPKGHFEGVSLELGRKLWLWDNYPVNDGPKMCPFLHLREFEGRNEVTAQYLAAHAINPMNQARLSRIPILALSMNWLDAAMGVLRDEAFARRLQADLPKFQDEGWEKLGADGRDRLYKVYSQFTETPARDELLAWIRGETQVTAAQTFLSQ